MLTSVLIPARVSWINPLPCRSDSVRTSFGLLLVYLDYLSALPCWILFADRRPTLALGLLSALSVSYLFADVFDPACFVTMSINKSLQMDPHASRLVGSVTEYSATQGSSGFPNGHLPGMDGAILLLALKQGTRSLERYIAEYLALANGSELPDCTHHTALNCMITAALEHTHKMAATAEPVHKMAATTTPRHVISASHESIQVTVHVKELSKVSVDVNGPSQVTIDRHESSQVTADRHESSQVTDDRHESSHVSADLPESFHVSADLPEPCLGTADLPESRHGTADLPESRQGTADHPE